MGITYNKYLKMKTVLACLLIISSYLGMAQQQLNDYKYIIVPKKFDGFKKENQYQTSTMVKFRLVQKNFIAVYDDSLPEELLLNRCLGLTINLEDLSGMLSTKVKLIFKDCSSRQVFETEVGRSSIKEFKPAYKESIDNALMSLPLDYKYNAKDATPPITVSFKNDVKKLESEKIVEQKSSIEEQSYKSLEPKPSQIKKAAPVILNHNSPVAKSNEAVLYAQEIKNGFQLVDSTPKIQLKVFLTSISDFYLAKSDDKDGVVYSKNGKWFFEYYKGEELIIEELNIKF